MTAAQDTADGAQPDPAADAAGSLGLLLAECCVMAGAADHLGPWQSCYSTQLLGRDCRFVLARSGHIACMVSPVGNPRTVYRTAAGVPPDPAAWLACAAAMPCSWWAGLAGWLAARGPQLPRPAGPGNADLPPLDAALGSYVFDR